MKSRHRKELTWIAALILLLIFSLALLITLSHTQRHSHGEALITESAVPILATSLTTSTTTTIPPSSPSRATTTTGITTTPVRSGVSPQPTTRRSGPPTSQPRPGGGVATAGGAGCMVNKAHSIAQAHACWDGLIGQYSWSTPRAFSVMMCESEGNPWDTNSEHANGLMQDLNGPFDPASNMAVAFQKYQASGWGPWAASESCWSSAEKG